MIVKEFVTILKDYMLPRTRMIVIRNPTKDLLIEISDRFSGKLVIIYSYFDMPVFKITDDYNDLPPQVMQPLFIGSEVDHKVMIKNFQKLHQALFNTNADRIFKGRTTE